jgi:pyrrolysine biosynthesis protein PylD
MTRLRSADIANISSHLDAYDEELFAKTGHTLRGIACHAVGLSEAETVDRLPGVHIGVVSIRWGKGMIGRFSETTRDILKHIGFQAFVTENSDVSGLAEAFEKRADIIFLSDDDHFVALNVECRRVVDNAGATGKGFGAGLNLMTGGLQGQGVLVIGCGAVGLSAAVTVAKYGAKISVYDADHSRSRHLASALYKMLNIKIEIESELIAALSKYRFLVEATNSADIIHEQDLSPETYIAAPGMPLGMSPDAAQKLAARLLHDPLQTGVATMGLEAWKQIRSQSS